MDKRLEAYYSQALQVLKSGYVRDIDFSGPTYQVEVFDPEFNESRWPFLQFDENGSLKDSFCSCPAEDGGCVHLAAAYLKIFNGSQLPLHERFESSFWNQICRLTGAHTGYDERFLQAGADGKYTYQNEVRFSIASKSKYAKKILSRLIEERPKETPENSIKFSNLSQEEIGRWKEGRPGPDLRYRLSFWSDLAKWMMRENTRSAAQVRYQEDHEGFPTVFTIDFPDFSAVFEIKKQDLTHLIPSLESADCGLKVFQSAEDNVIHISFDPHTATFHLSHASLKSEHLDKQYLQLEGWAYLQGIGFFPKGGSTLLSRALIPKEECGAFLDHYHHLIAQYIPVQIKSRPVLYAMHFDSNWNWHFSAYLFEKRDLQDAVFLDGWIYIKGKGFYAIEKPLFNKPEMVLAPSQISHFVNHHRIWLNGQEGFQTHLASIESYLSYTLTETHILQFHTKTRAESHDMMDFGDWIYYAGQGFFSKKHARLGLVVRPGLEVRPEEISSFIKANKEELEIIPRFFTQTLPLASRGLEINVLSATSIQVKPVYTLLPDYSDGEVHLFGDFVYVAKEGFYELPVSMRLPDHYAQPIVFSQTTLPLFFETELPFLRKYLQKIDPALLTPHKVDLVIEYLVRASGGGLKAQFFYQSEYGKIAVTDLLQALEHKKRYCFSAAGLIDLHADSFQWLRHFKSPYHFETQTLELSTLEIIKLDATVGILCPPSDSSTANITRNLLKELREFTSHESPNLKGLKSELRLYQQTGLHWLWFLYKNGLSGLLCDDMGLGKTHQAMALIAATLNQKTTTNKRYLVVCPTSVIYHWQDKLETFLPHIKVHTFHGLKRSLHKMPSEGLLLTSYGILRMEKKKLEEIPFEVAIFDEVQIAKNPHSRVHEALRGIKARTRIGLSGTPIENNLRELKSLFDIVLPGYMPSETRYKELFINPIERDMNEEKKALLSQLIRPFVLRRRKAEVLQELPEKSEDKSYCDLSEQQIKLYTATLSQMRDSLVADLRDQSSTVNYIHIFSLLSQLKQICNHPALFYKDPKNYKAYASGKWELFTELLEEARESEQKVVIFSQYLAMLDIIEQYLIERRWEYAQIRGDTINRREELKRFQEDPKCIIFIGSLQAAGLGIDLTAASVVILYDRWWNAARENQAIDRVHRIGQKWGVQVYKLITKNTIEEKIDKMITRKGRLLEEVISSDDQAALKKFSRSELIDLLTFSTIEDSRE